MLRMLLGRGGTVGQRVSVPSVRCSAPRLMRSRQALSPLSGSNRGIVNAETVGSVVRVDKEHWSAFMFGRERQLLIHVINTAEEGNAQSVMGAMDSFWASTFDMAGTDSWSIRGDVIDKVMQDRKPVRCMEIGTYCGYSALRIARNLPADGLLVSIEVDPLFAAIATKIVEHAGLAGKVKILMGTIKQRSDRISECLSSRPIASAPSGSVDFLLCDHSKDLFVPDLKLLEDAGIAGPGTVVMGDTTVYPGDVSGERGQDLLSYFAKHPSYRVQQHIGTQQTSGITVSEWVHLP